MSRQEKLHSIHSQELVEVKFIYLLKSNLISVLFMHSQGEFQLHLTNLQERF